MYTPLCARWVTTSFGPFSWKEKVYKLNACINALKILFSQL